MADNFLEPEEDQAIPVNSPSEQMPGLAGLIRSKFEDAENGRYAHEQRWLQAYKNFRGIYDSTTQYRDSERSKVFIKITKTKVLAAYGQIVDILFANKKFPIVVESTPMPEGIEEFAHMRTPLDEAQQQPMDPYGFPGDGRDLPPGGAAKCSRCEAVNPSWANHSWNLLRKWHVRWRSVFTTSFSIPTLSTFFARQSLSLPC